MTQPAGLLILIVGPSGAGKDTLIRGARESLAGDAAMVFPRRIVSRPPSPSEDNVYLDAATLDWLAAQEAFCLSWQAHGLSYALPRSVETALARGATVVCNVSRAVVDAARARFATHVIQIEAAPEVLAARLAERRRDSDGDLGERLARADTLPCRPDEVFHNDSPLPQAIQSFSRRLLSLSRQGEGRDLA